MIKCERRLFWSICKDIPKIPTKTIAVERIFEVSVAVFLFHIIKGLGDLGMGVSLICIIIILYLLLWTVCKYFNYTSPLKVKKKG